MKDVLDTLYPKLSVSGEAFSCALELSQKNGRDITLEIGFGGGEHLIAQAQNHPERIFIGAEPFVNGMARTLTDIDDAGISNIYLYLGDVRDIWEILPNSVLNQVFILFPDPWPKKRHQRRRLVNQEFLSTLREKCKIGAKIRFATDVEDYANTAMIAFFQTNGIDWTAESCDDWLIAPCDHVTTRYEQKRLGDIDPVYYDFVVTPYDD